MVEFSSLRFWRRTVQPSFIERQTARYERACELLDANTALSSALRERLNEALVDAKKSVATMIGHRGIETWRGEGYLTQLDRATARLVETLEMLAMLKTLKPQVTTETTDPRDPTEPMETHAEDDDTDSDTDTDDTDALDRNTAAFFAYRTIADHVDRVDGLAMAVAAIRYEPFMVTVLAYGFVLIPFLNLASIIFGAALLLFYGGRDPRARLHGTLVLIFVTAQLLIVQFLHLSYSIL